MILQRTINLSRIETMIHWVNEPNVRSDKNLEKLLPIYKPGKVGFALEAALVIYNATGIEHIVAVHQNEHRRYFLRLNSDHGREIPHVIFARKSIPCVRNRIDLRIRYRRVVSRCVHTKDSSHATHHVIQNMAMKKPIAIVTRRELYSVDFHRHDVYHVFEWRIIAHAIQYSEVVAMQVHGVPHHRLVIQNNANILSLTNQNSIRIGKHDVVD